jgi:predicted DNA-binding transcriptional regulator AlpA
MEDDPLLPITAAARKAGVSRATVWRMVSSGQLAPHDRTPGGHLRFRAGQLSREFAAIRAARIATPNRETP